MPIRVEHGRPETLIAAAKRAGEAQAALRAQEKAEKLQAQQMEFDYRTALRQQDVAIDLQMQERAKMWEIEKMELRSRMDFEREEKRRQRKLDEKQARLDALEKAQEAGTISKKDYEAAYLRVITGVPFGLERQLTEQQKFKEAMAKRMRGALTGAATGIPTGGRVRVMSPEGQSGTIDASEVGEYKEKGFTIVGEAGIPTAKPQITETQARAGVEKYTHPSWRRFFTQSPVRTAVELYNVRKYGM